MTATFSGHRAAFLDRDGVLNRKREGDYVKSWDEFEWLPDVVPALKLLQGAGYRLVVVTNQSLVGRGLRPRAAVDEIHERLKRELKRQGVALEGIFVCPHAPNEGCRCRKPEPGLLLEAAQTLRLDLARSLLLGDSESDLEAGRRAGVARVVRVPPGVSLLSIVSDLVKQDPS